jgi:hypothetical protein
MKAVPSYPPDLNPPDGVTAMRVKISDDNQNWLNWGNLIQKWIDSPASRPNTVGDLRGQFKDNRIQGEVAGDDTRLVSILSYTDDPDETLLIMVPTKAARDAKLSTVKPGPYVNMPLFYDIVYAGAARANLSQQEALNFAIRRIGEYSVNECC